MSVTASEKLPYNWTRLIGNTEIPDARGLRRFGVVGGGLFALVFGAYFPWRHGQHVPAWVPLFIGGAVILAAWAVPRSIKPIYFIWMALGHVLGFINSRIILGVTFFLIVFPMGLLRRMIQRAPFGGVFRENVPSYRVLSKKPPREGLKNLW